MTYPLIDRARWYVPCNLLLEIYTATILLFLEIFCKMSNSKNKRFICSIGNSWILKNHQVFKTKTKKLGKISPHFNRHVSVGTVFYSFSPVFSRSKSFLQTFQQFRLNPCWDDGVTMLHQKTEREEKTNSSLHNLQVAAVVVHAMPIMNSTNRS
jgi:hypothetical protein